VGEHDDAAERVLIPPAEHRHRQDRVVFEGHELWRTGRGRTDGLGEPWSWRHGGICPPGDHLGAHGWVEQLSGGGVQGEPDLVGLVRLGVGVAVDLFELILQCDDDCCIVEPSRIKSQQRERTTRSCL